MTYQDLKTFIETLSEEQLTQTVAVFNGDDETAILPDYGYISEEDEYFDHSDSLGTKEQFLSEDGNKEEDLEDYTRVPKGTVSIHSK